MLDPSAYLALAAVAAVAAALNVVAGGGSFLTLPVLIFFGLPPTVANATNRVGVFVQSAGAVWGFHRQRLLDWPSGLRAGLPASLGALAGTWLALQVGDAAFRRVLAALMVAVTLWTLLPKPRRAAVDRGNRGPAFFLSFLLVGVYGGFVQAGVGFLLLAVTSWSGLDLARGNAVKVLCVALLTTLSLGIFAWQGLVEWASGLALALGGLAGSLLGVRLVAVASERWLRRVVVVAVAVFALKLWFG